MTAPQIFIIAFCVVTFGSVAFALFRANRPMTDEDRWRASKTVRVETTATLDKTAEAVRGKLADPRFTEINEKVAGCHFHAYFRRSKWVLGVGIEVSLVPSATGTTVSVQCFTEWFAGADMLVMFYNEMQTFLAGVRAACAVEGA